MAYARHLLETAEDHLAFVGINPLNGIGALPKDAASRLVADLDALWRGSGASEIDAAAVRRLALQLKMQTFWNRGAQHAPGSRQNPGRPVYLLVSHHHLERPEPIRRLLAARGARFVTLVHDLIPIEWPEYARPISVRRHYRRMETVARFADGIIFNSEETARSFRQFLPPGGREIPMVVAPLAPSLAPSIAEPVKGSREPYFVCLGTIEPRKNHLMLLAVWRRITEELGPKAPRLILIGQRGWENENIVDLLERSPAIRKTVEEHNDLPDAQVATLLAGARALLFPSFVEGYGLPVVEALAAGVPVVCSTIAPFLEISGGVADYIDPLDGLGWKAAIEDYAQPDSPRRAAQLDRLATWREPTWNQHFAAVDDLIHRVGTAP